VRGILLGVVGTARNLRYGFLLRPFLATTALAVLAFVLVQIDRAAGKEGVEFGFGAGPDGARSVLSTIAASLITVAGLTFSIMIVTLQLVSQQFSPRALRTFLGDRLNQFIAGYFIGVFVYCLLVLRTVRAGAGDDERFVPALSITVAIVLALVALALLLVFIDRMASRIQVSTIASDVAHETLGTLDDIYPESFGKSAEGDWQHELAAWRAASLPESVYASRPGYVQTAEIDDVPEAEGSPGLRIHVRVAPGQFVTEAQPTAEVWHGEHDGRVEDALERAIVIGNERDLAQDAGYGVRQLADIAKRAISPSMNDPTTAWTCIHYIRAILERLACREFPAMLRRYDGGRIAVIARRAEWDEYVEAGLVQVARHARDPRVAGALAESALAVADAGRCCGATERLPTLAKLAPVIEATVEPAGADDEREIGRLTAALRELAQRRGE